MATDRTVITSADLSRLNGKISQARRNGRPCADLEREYAAARIRDFACKVMTNSPKPLTIAEITAITQTLTKVES